MTEPAPVGKPRGDVPSDLRRVGTWIAIAFGVMSLASEEPLYAIAWFLLAHVFQIGHQPRPRV